MSFLTSERSPRLAPGDPEQTGGEIENDRPAEEHKSTPRDLNGALAEPKLRRRSQAKPAGLCFHVKQQVGNTTDLWTVTAISGSPNELCRHLGSLLLNLARRLSVAEGGSRY